MRGLAARDVAFQHQRRQPVGRRVDRSGQPGWARADDRQVVVLVGRLVALLPGGEELLDRDSCQDARPIDHHRRGRMLGLDRRKERICLRGAGLEVLIRLRRPGQEVAQPMVLRVQPSPDQLDGRAYRAHSVRRTNISSST